MAESKKWTDDEVKELLSLVEEKGQSDAIKAHASKTGRTADAVRRKLNHLKETIAVSDEEEEILDEVVNDPRYSDENYVESPSILKRFWRWLTFQN